MRTVSRKRGSCTLMKVFSVVANAMAEYSSCSRSSHMLIGDNKVQTLPVPRKAKSSLTNPLRVSSS
jgi:hypothetical protein